MRLSTDAMNTMPPYSAGEDSTQLNVGEDQITSPVAASNL